MIWAPVSGMVAVFGCACANDEVLADCEGFYVSSLLGGQKFTPSYQFQAKLSLLNLLPRHFFIQLLFSPLSYSQPLILAGLFSFSISEALV